MDNEWQCHEHTPLHVASTQQKHSGYEPVKPLECSAICVPAEAVRQMDKLGEVFFILWTFLEQMKLHSIPAWHTVLNQLTFYEILKL